jgi:Sulfate permease and related transporters (MFS superfamily)
MKSLPQDWFGNVKNDLLAGLVVALALIPEAIAFSIIAGVDPKVGLYASFSMAVVIAFAGGRPGMISAATGAMALVMVMLVKDHGLQYLFAATLLTGVLQIVAGMLRLDLLMRFVSRAVIVGFVNALAILIFYGAIAGVGRAWLVGVCNGCCRFGDYLPVPVCNQSCAIAVGGNRGVERGGDGVWAGNSHRWRYGRVAG